jgi:hypothetical protein
MKLKVFLKKPQSFKLGRLILKFKQILSATTNSPSQPTNKAQPYE